MRQSDLQMIALSWHFQPVRRLLLPGDPFFEEGDIQCNILRKQINLGDELWELLECCTPEFECSVPGCSECFINIARYESHYKSCHWHCCRYCKKSFPSNFLLDIHILENHDTLFQMIALKKHMYKCLVECCPDKFSSEEERKDHLVRIHQYPSDFRFNRPSRTQRRKKRKEQSSQPKGLQTNQESPVDTLMETIASSQTEEDSKVTSQSSNTRQRMPKTICFGRGSARAFQRDSIPKVTGSKKKSGGGKKSKKQQTRTQTALSQEVVMGEATSLN